MMRKSAGLILLIFLLLLAIAPLVAKVPSYVTAEPKTGDGVNVLFDRYGIPFTTLYRSKFIELNKRKFDKKGNLMLSFKYKLPIYECEYDGRTIRSSLGISDFKHAKRIEKYNKSLVSAGIKKPIYKNDKKLWVLYYDFMISGNPTKTIVKKKKRKYPFLGEARQNVRITDNSLKNNIYYLVCGHGGPDPGAIGKYGNHGLCEDEYAYDVTLRLAEQLISRDATVYMIVEDPNDGIRDDALLHCDRDEFYCGGDTISKDQVTRLRKRVSIINKLYRENRKSGKKQEVVVIHLDSRTLKKRIDIFFYHSPGSTSGKKLARKMLKTIKQKYQQAQPGRGYEGTIKSRNLYILRKTVPTCVFIELGNIRNKQDQIRFVDKNNRQAIANWLAAGLMRR